MVRDHPAREFTREIGGGCKRVEIRAASRGGHDAFVAGELDQQFPQVLALGLAPMRKQRLPGAIDDGFGPQANVPLEPVTGCSLNYPRGDPRQKRESRHQGKRETNTPLYLHGVPRVCASHFNRKLRFATLCAMRLENLGLIGNCQFSALVSRTGEVVWCCLPRFDSEPVFSTLLDEQNGGRFTVGAPDGTEGTQRYLDNTNVLETTFRTPSGSFRVIDFAPRLVQYERVTRPTQLYRIVEPIEGTPQVRVVCEPRLGWSKAAPLVLPGSNHIRFEGFGSPLRLTTDIPPSYLGGQSFVLTERRHLVLAWGAPVEEPLPGLCERFLHDTMRYWQQWIKHCNIPPMFQKEVIRSALALKLHCFEDTGAIIASVTTSIPEAPGSGRTWDYRYCWLRDAYYALDAFRMLGHFEERESFTNFLLNVAGNDPELTLKPIYRIDGTTDLEERTLDHWPGFNGDGPVRVGNAAALQTQHDIFGEMVLALAPVFLDERFSAERSPASYALLERLVRKAIAVAGTPDAGIWEYRMEQKPRTFSSLMSWAAADRMANIAGRYSPAHAAEFRDAADTHSPADRRQGLEPRAGRIRRDVRRQRSGRLPARNGGFAIFAAG